VGRPERRRPAREVPALDNAIAAQVAFEGSYEQRAGFPVPDGAGRETPLKAPVGQFLSNSDCHDQSSRPINDRDFTWFDFDCDYCTGAYSTILHTGLFHRTWLAESPPPSPNTNLNVTYNYSQNPDRRFAPAGDGEVRVSWDNLSEVSPDPKSGQFDFRGYKIWKVSNWTRPVGSGGPAEDDWTLLAEYRLFNYANNNKFVNVAGDTVCPRIYVPQSADSVDLCLQRGDLWDRQSGKIIRPDPTVNCVLGPNGKCVIDSAFTLGTSGLRPNEGRTLYAIGRYTYADKEVKNGFLYFYSVTAFDSTGFGQGKVELNGRRAAVEAEGVVPQMATTNSHTGHVWVVPNPYRGLHAIQERPSAWDLTPNASDPTGTHIDFLGLPAGKWSIKIFTLSGDWVATINSDDAVNASTRNSNVIDSQGHAHPNVNLQQDTPSDGEGRWNLISRNGQDVVSGIYLYTVQSSRGSERGKFVIIR
jgi:hypothetical protein